MKRIIKKTGNSRNNTDSISSNDNNVNNYSNSKYKLGI